VTVLIPELSVISVLNPMPAAQAVEDNDNAQPMTKVCARTLQQFVG
jgi:hypothetical protein